MEVNNNDKNNSNKVETITPGEITELIRRQKSIDSEMEKWIASIQLALSAEG